MTADEVTALYTTCSASSPIYYDSTNHVLRYCGTDGIVRNTGTPGAGGAGCSASGALAAGDEGSYQYDSTNNKYVFCGGTSWVDIP